MSYSKEDLRDMFDGTLPWNKTFEIMSKPKDDDRFDKYVAILQERVSYDEKILMPLGDHLNVVDKDGERIVKCDCGHEFGDYRINWKLGCQVYVRKTDEEIGEVVTIPEARHNTDLVEMREFYCPGCYALLGVEVVPPGYPPMFEMLPDLDAFYREWLVEPLPDESPDWFQDKTLEKPAEWAKEG